MIHDFISTIFTPASCLNVLSDVEKISGNNFQPKKSGRSSSPNKNLRTKIRWGAGARAQARLEMLRPARRGKSRRNNFTLKCQVWTMRRVGFMMRLHDIVFHKSWNSMETFFSCNIHLYFDLWDKPDPVTVKHMSHMFFLGDYIWISKRSPRLPSSLTLWN